MTSFCLILSFLTFSSMSWGARAGLLNSLLGQERQQDRGRATHQTGLRDLLQNPLLNSQNQNPSSVNLINLFPQNMPNNQLDSETREKLTEQKEKLEGILSNLQELNKQKDKQREKEGLGAARPNNVFNNNVTTRPGLTTTTTRRPYVDDDDNKYLYNPNPKPKIPNGWTKLNKKKFLFQVQPVRPDTEIGDRDLKTVYYLD